MEFTESAELRSVVAYISRRKEQRLIQSFMALHDNFEGLCGAILHRNHLPSVDYVVNKLLAGEVRLKSKIDKETSPPATPDVLVAPYRSSDGSAPRTSMAVPLDKCVFL